jgi:hypothetical protein
VTLSNIIQGDNGTLLEFTVKDDSGVVDLSNAQSVLFRLKKSFLNTVEKVCTVTDSVNGKAQVTLSSSDTDSSGRFSYQVTVTFVDGSEFTSEPMILTIDRKY